MLRNKQERREQPLRAPSNRREMVRGQKAQRGQRVRRRGRRRLGELVDRVHRLVRGRWLKLGRRLPVLGLASIVYEALGVGRSRVVVGGLVVLVDKRVVDRRVIRISAEPLLGRIILDHKDAKANLDWLITGGESGPGFRPLDMDAVRYLRDQCRELGVTFHHKQNGGVRGKDNGCLIDGQEHKFFPAALAA